VLLSFLGFAALDVALVVIVVAIVLFRRPGYHASAHIEIISSDRSN
jgi:hypothetical protein